VGLKKPAISLLILYAVLTGALALRLALGLPFQLWLVILQPLVGFGFSLLHAIEYLGLRRAFFFLGLTLTVSLLFEAVGVASGWIYGPYHYAGGRLGPLILGLVPALIPLTWFMMLYPSYVIAERCAPLEWGAKPRRLGVAALGGLILVAWDLALDPLMAAQGHWIWETRGAFFGVPLRNFWGWWLTAFVVLMLYLSFQAKPDREASVEMARFGRLAALGYLVAGFGSVAQAWLHGLIGPALIGGAAMLFWAVVGWRAQAQPVISFRKL
jgi:putative membrane protein